MKTASTILGIDPGYGRVGWCIGQAAGSDLNLIKYGCIETPPQLSLMDRYRQIQTDLQIIIREFQPQEAALESLFFTNNQKTAMHVSEARGLMIGVLLAQQIACFEYTPLQIKQAVTGFGRADKTAVERMLRLQFHFGHDIMLDDTMDAIAVTLTHTVSRNLKTRI